MKQELQAWTCLRVSIVQVRVREDRATFLAMRSLKESTKERTKTMRILHRLHVYLLAFGAVAMLMTGLVSEAQDRSQGRSMVVSRNGIVAAESPLAAQAGVRVFGRGGKAVGGAIAAKAQMGGVEPVMNGLRGGWFCVLLCSEDQQSL